MLDFLKQRVQSKTQTTDIFAQLDSYPDFLSTRGCVLGIYTDENSMATLKKFKNNSDKIRVKDSSVIGCRGFGIFDLHIKSNIGSLTVVYIDGGFSIKSLQPIFDNSLKIKSCYLRDEIYNSLPTLNIHPDDKNRLSKINSICRYNKNDFSNSYTELLEK